MKKLYCDLCGDQMEDYDNYIKIDTDKTKDICVECLDKVRKFCLTLAKQKEEINIIKEEYIEEGKFEETQYD